MAAPMNISAVTKLLQVQLFRSNLEKKGYYDSTRRIQKIDQSYSAVPVTKEFFEIITQDHYHACFSDSYQTDVHSKSLPLNEVVDKNRCLRYETDDCYKNQVKKLSLETFLFENTEFRFDIIQSQPSKKAKVKSPYDVMLLNLKALFKRNSIKLTDISVDEQSSLWLKEFESDLPTSWEKHGDLILLQDGCFKHKVWSQLGTNIWTEVAKALGCKRLASISRISTDGFRTPQLELLLGENGWVQHIDNGIKYSYDVTQCMFSSGNVTEKLRVASFNCTGETVVDLYAGIGYFTLPYLVHTRASHVHACEWNPAALEALKKNIQLNQVQDRCTVHAGDNRKLTLKGIADRVNLGLIPTSEGAWRVACQVLKPGTGGTLHIHENVESTPPNIISSSSKSSKIEEVSNYEICVHNVEGNDVLAFKEQTYCLTNKTDETVRVSNAQVNTVTDHLKSCIEPEVSNTATNQNVCETEYNSDNGSMENLQSTVPSNTYLNENERKETSDVTSKTEQHIDIRSKEKYNNFTNKKLKYSKKTVVRKSWQDWADRTVLKIESLLENIHGGKWNVIILHIEHVKSYAPYVDHIVLDLECKPHLLDV